MKTKHFLKLLLLLLCTINFVSCNNDDPDIQPFRIEKKSYEVMKGGSHGFSISSGSGNLSVTVADPAILSAQFSKDNYKGIIGYLRLDGKQKGETTVTITDNVTQETEYLKIKVIDKYLAYGIEDSNHPALESSIIIYLINNEARDCYFFRYIHSNNKVFDTPIAKGTYNFSLNPESDGPDLTTDYTPYLTLTYSSDEHGKFTDATIVPSIHQFRFEMYKNGGISNNVFSIIQYYLDINWEKLTQQQTPQKKDHSTRNNVIISPKLEITEDDTEYRIIGTLATHPTMPEGILK